MYCQTPSVSAAGALRIMLLTVSRVGRSYELFPDGRYTSETLNWQNPEPVKTQTGENLNRMSPPPTTVIVVY